MKPERPIPRIRAVRFAPGDTIILHIPQIVSMDQKKRMLETLAKTYPDNQYLILEGDMRLSVMRKRP